jgi:hypothetical protein
MPIFRRPPKESPALVADGVLWGVARREAASDRDDPLLHTGLVQHAFVLGTDEQAVCGFRPPQSAGFGGRTRVPQLALPGVDNPRCSKCVRLIAETAPAAPVAPESPRAAESDHESTEAGEDDALEAAVSIEADASPDAVDSADEHEDTDSARDETRAPRRSSVRRAGRITVPPGRRSVVTNLPPKWQGAAITADVVGSPDELRVQSIRVGDDGTVRITLNQRTTAPVELVLYLVSSPERP